MSTSTHEVYGAPCWVSLMARDLAAAEHFYGEVLGWSFRPTRLGEAFRVAFRDGIPVAGIGAFAEKLSVPVAWTPYFAVDDADVTAARIVERSGTLAVGPLTFGTGRAALAADREGAVFGIWQGNAIPDWHVGRENAPAWLELRTRHALDAAIFYGEVLDWACDTEGCCDASYEDGHVVLRHSGHPVARIRGGAPEDAPDPQIRPRWHVNFRVLDLEAAVATALRLGGSEVSTGRDEPGRRHATLRDPDGGLFTIATTAEADRYEPTRPLI
ncbi:VOC family protein [Streptomyces sp. NPDC002054]|uniref:VOC family protein n=1 Tax=Streptomyces sp. NPDC002054 TaxID=3154663 RepID=UPI003328D685